MLRIFITLIIYALGFAGLAQTPQNSDKNAGEKNMHQIDVIINDIITDNGKVYFAIYDSEMNFNARKPLKIEISEIHEGIANVSFDDLESNTYAITCFHDANSNGKMDFADNGMPIEDYGISNNIVSLGPPRFGDAKFDLIDKDLTFEIEF